MAKKILRILCFSLAAASCCASHAARQTTMLPGTVKNFELPNFDENTGVKEWELFGDNAKYTSDTRVDIEGIKLDLYEGKEEAKLRATIKSPAAKVNPNTKISESDSVLTVNASDFDMTGKKWKWNGNKRYVEVFSDVVISVKNDSDKDNPTVLKSDFASLDYRGESNIFKLQKNVSATNREMVLNCDAVEADSKKSEKGVGKIVASGNVKMLRDKRRAEADKAEILPDSGIATLVGNPKITDIPSKAKLNGAYIVLDKNAKTVSSFGENKTRAKAEIFHTEADGKERKIEIFADNIVMSQKEKENLFNFVGDVKILAEDFKAECAKLEASAANIEGEKSKLSYIKGFGKVKFENEDGVATGKELEIYPEKSEIWLADNARLENPKRGTTLNAHAMVFVQNKNKGIALSDSKDKKSFVTVTLRESADIDSAIGKKTAKAKPDATVVKSRHLNFSRSEKSAEFVFNKDVSIKSSDINATCQKMNVFAETDNSGTTTLKKIVAADNVSVSQKGYSAEAEIATIYPRLKMKDAADSEKKNHKFVELSTDPQNPGRRPTVTLPPLKNIGIKDSASAAKIAPSKTVIKSDKQWLTSSENIDRYYFQGDVSVEATDMKAACEKIEVSMKPQKNGQKEITHIAMTEDVRLEQGLKEVRCGRADIYADEQMIVLSDNPVVMNREDNSRVSGYRIVYNKGSQSIAVEGENTPESGSGKASPFVRPTTPDEDDEAPARPTIKLPVKQN